jgi:hypothetical protein
MPKAENSKTKKEKPYVPPSRVSSRVAAQPKKANPLNQLTKEQLVNTFYNLDPKANKNNRNKIKAYLKEVHNVNVGPHRRFAGEVPAWVGNLGKGVVKRYGRENTGAVPFIPVPGNKPTPVTVLASRIAATPLFSIGQFAAKAGGVLETTAIEIAARHAGDGVIDLKRNLADSISVLFNTNSPRTWFFKSRFSLRPFKLYAIGPRARNNAEAAFYSETRGAIESLKALQGILNENWTLDLAAGDPKNNNNNNNSNNLNSAGKGRYFVEADVTARIKGGATRIINGRSVTVDKYIGIECKITKGKRESTPAEAIQLLKWKITVLLHWRKNQMRNRGRIVDYPPVIELYFLGWFFGVFTTNTREKLWQRVDFTPLDEFTAARIDTEMATEWGVEPPGKKFTTIVTLNPKSFSEVTGLNKELVEGALASERMVLLQTLAKDILKYKRRGINVMGIDVSKHPSGVNTNVLYAQAGIKRRITLPTGNTTARAEGRWGNYVASVRAKNPATVNSREKQNAINIIRDKYPKAFSVMMTRYGMNALNSNGTSANIPVPARENKPPSVDDFIKHFGIVHNAIRHKENFKAKGFGAFYKWLKNTRVGFQNTARIPPAALNRLRADPRYADTLVEVGLGSNQSSSINRAVASAVASYNASLKNNSSKILDLYKTFLRDHAPNKNSIRAALTRLNQSRAMNSKIIPKANFNTMWNVASENNMS